MRIGIPAETRDGETRVAATAETIKKLAAAGHQILVQRGAGTAASQIDSALEAAGATLVDAAQAFGAEIVLKVRAPQPAELELMARGTVLVGMLNPFDRDGLQALAGAGVTAFALEAAPRTTRAQSMDVLSSQANIAGYKAVLLAAAELDRYVPMLMTAAGTIQPARVLILGAGVAGLQALATARRLGGVVYVSDVRAAAKEQVESLGGRFLDPPSEQDLPSEKGGYATQASEAFLSAQRQQLAEQLALADMVICTAQVPGRPAPRLITEDMLDRMRPGAVVVDLAVAQGGNCAGTLPGETVLRSGVRLIGAEALPSSVPNHASALYARNVAALIEHLVHEEEGLRLDLNDPIVEACLFTHAGACRRDDVVQTGAPLIPAGTAS
jgi:NAD(P) transhydrogenase subunit alpha